MQSQLRMTHQSFSMQLFGFDVNHIADITKVLLFSRLRPLSFYSRDKLLYLPKQHNDEEFDIRSDIKWWKR